MLQSEMKLKYPILLVHGIAYRDDIGIYRYWGDIPEYLESKGCKVFLCGQNAFDTNARNGEYTAKRIKEISEANNNCKVNIIAHSKGGIEARYAISTEGTAQRVASLTTLATPHKGSILAELIFDLLQKKLVRKIVINILSVYAKILGDRSPNFMQACKDLTPESMNKFNERIINSPDVYYQSYAASISENYPGLWLSIKRKKIAKHEGENDGVIAVESAKWGDYKGIAGDEVSHFEIIGIAKRTNFAYKEFILRIIKELEEKGF